MHPNAYVVKALISKDRISWILRTRVSRIEIYFRAAKFTIYPKKRKNNYFGRCWIAFKSIRLWNSDSLLRRGGVIPVFRHWRMVLFSLTDLIFVCIILFWLINEFFAREEYNYVREIFFSLKSSLFIKEKGFLLREKISVKDALICFQSFQLNNQNKFFANFAKKISKEIG